MRRVSREVGPIICSGITRPTRSICSPTRRARRSSRRTRSKGRFTPRSGSLWTCRSSSRRKIRDLYAEPLLQQRGAARHLLPLYRRHRYLARYDDHVNSKEEKIDVSNFDVSIELQDRDLFAAIRERRESNTSVTQVPSCYEVLHSLEQLLVRA
jgi:hypothetical protein